MSRSISSLKKFTSATLTEG